MRRLRVTFPTSLSEKDEALRTEVYWEEFRGTTIEDFTKGVREAISKCGFFPKPSELWEYIKPSWIEESKYLEESTRKCLGHSEEWISAEKAEAILEKIKQSDDYKKIMREATEDEDMSPKPVIKDEKMAEEFERMRTEAIEKAKKILN
jgi:hypothetical protein